MLKTMKMTAPAREQQQPGVKTNADFIFVAIARKERHATSHFKLMGQSPRKKLSSSFANRNSTRKQLSTSGIYPKRKNGQWSTGEKWHMSDNRLLSWESANRMRNMAIKGTLNGRMAELIISIEKQMTIIWVNQERRARFTVMKPKR